MLRGLTCTRRAAVATSAFDGDIAIKLGLSSGERLVAFKTKEIPPRLLSGRCVPVKIPVFQTDDLSFTKYHLDPYCLFLLNFVLHSVVRSNMYLHVVTYKKPTLAETFAKNLPRAKTATDVHWDAEIKDQVLFVGKRWKTWYFHKDVGG